MNGTGNEQYISAVSVPTSRLHAHLIAKRFAVGAKTPKGHACSNLVEQLAAYRTATGDQKANLERLIPLQMARLGSQ